jgi:hypothetical protein
MLTCRPISWQRRTCPVCHVVRASTAFAILDAYRPSWSPASDMRRRCPACRYLGPSGDFRSVVSE